MRKEFDFIRIAECVLMLLLVIYIGVLLSSKENSNASFASVEKAVYLAVQSKTLEEADGQLMKRLYGINEKDFDDIILSYTNETMGVEEILLIKDKNAESLDAAEEAVQKRVSTQKKNFEGYGEEQVKLLNQAVVERKGNFLLFVVSPNAEKCRKAFLNTL